MNASVTVTVTLSWECATITQESVSVWTIRLVSTVRIALMVTMATHSKLL